MKSVESEWKAREMNSRFALPKAGLIVLVGLLVAACGSGPRAQHYTINFSPVASGSSDMGTSAVGVAVPRASHLLRQDRIVYFSSDNELNFYQRHRWADSPTRLVQSALIRQLRAANLFDDIVPYRAQKGLDYVLRGHLLSMEEVDAPEEIKARFALELELVRQEDDHVVWTGRHSCERGVATKSVPAVVESLSGCVQESLGELTRSLATSLPQIEAARKAEATSKP